MQSAMELTVPSTARELRLERVDDDAVVDNTAMSCANFLSLTKEIQCQSYCMKILQYFKMCNTFNTKSDRPEVVDGSKVSFHSPFPPPEVVNLATSAPSSDASHASDTNLGTLKLKFENQITNKSNI